MPRLAIRALVIMALLSAACGESPTAPSPLQPQIPQVAGTYAGSVRLTADGRFLGSGTAQMTVVQVGAQLTITGYMSVGGTTSQLSAITGTINATGFVTITSAPPPSVRDPTCGTIAAAGSSLTFSGNTVRFVSNSTTTYCGNLQAAGTLTRGARFTPTVPMRPVDARFRDRFWQELVFNQHSDPGNITTRRSWVLENPSPNVYIRMGDPRGRRVVSHQQRDHIRRAVPELVSQLTGSPYRGRIESGIEDRTRRGWITVRFVTQEEEPGACRGVVWPGADRCRPWLDLDRAAGARAKVLRGRVWLRAPLRARDGARHGVLSRGEPLRCDEPRVWRSKYVHRDRAISRAPRLRGRTRPRVCGWPFQASCTRRGSSLRGLAPIVID